MAAMTDEIKVYDEGYPVSPPARIDRGTSGPPIIVYILGQGTKRYGELRRHLPDVSKKMLTQTLRALERDGLLKRKVYGRSAAEGRLRPDPAGPGIPGAGDFALRLGARRIRATLKPPMRNGRRAARRSDEAD